MVAFTRWYMITLIGISVTLSLWIIDSGQGTDHFWAALLVCTGLFVVQLAIPVLIGFSIFLVLIGKRPHFDTIAFIRELKK